MSAVRNLCSVPSIAIFSFLRFNCLILILLTFLLERSVWILEVSTNRLHRPPLRWFVWRFVPGNDYMVRHFSFSNSCHISWDLLWQYRNVKCCPLEKELILSLTTLVDSILGFVHWCNSNGRTLNPVCTVNRITLKSLSYIWWDRPYPLKWQFSSSLRLWSKFSHSFAGVLSRWTIFQFDVFYKILYTLQLWKHYHCLISFLSDAVKVDEAFQEFKDFIVLFDIQIQTSGPLQYRSIPTKVYDSPVECLLYKLPKKSKCAPCPGLGNTGSLLLRSKAIGTLGSWRNSMHARHVLHLYSMSFLILDHQKMLLSANIFVDPEFGSVARAPFVSSILRASRFLSPANNKPNRFEKLLITGKILRGLFFLLFPKHTFSWSSFRSTIKLNSAFLEFSAALVFLVFGYYFTWLTWR